MEREILRGEHAQGSQSEEEVTDLSFRLKVPVILYLLPSEEPKRRTSPFLSLSNINRSINRHFIASLKQTSGLDREKENYPSEKGRGEFLFV